MRDATPLIKRSSAEQESTFLASHFFPRNRSKQWNQEVRSGDPRRTAISSQILKHCNNIMTYKSTASNATRAASPTRQVWFSRTDVIITCSYPDDRDTSTPTTTVTYAQHKHEESVSRKQDPMAAAMRRARRSRNGSILREAVSYVREIVAVQHKIRRKYRPEEATVVLGRYATLKTKLNRIEAWEKARATTHDAMKIHQEASVVESRNTKRRRCYETNEKRSLVKLLFRGFPTGAHKSKASFFAAAPPARQISAY
ncbi:expressed unknown protein [Seminavis robusta]|uniref:Uncharacterized protein n=1 Tax=Seminavis robusta TaxID=568900 RepID=A0A9N8EDT4_9STRA|nr:expressed unknown protein [Seminavis robusta]|eukprot:Sro1031_g233380.1 n/a (256) ;mRNA; f:3222-3989